MPLSFASLPFLRPSFLPSFLSLGYQGRKDTRKGMISRKEGYQGRKEGYQGRKDIKEGS
jgi:hypothetical protein